MPSEKDQICRSCADCGVMNCLSRKGSYPEFCPTAELTEEEINEVVSLYMNSRINKKVAVASAEIEGECRGYTVKTEISFAGESILTLETAAQPLTEFRFPISAPRPWSP